MNKVVPDAKSGFGETSADLCRNGGTTSTQHAYPEAEGRDQKHVVVGLEAYDNANRTGGDMITSMSMGSDGNKGMSTGTSMGSDRDMGTSRDMGMSMGMDKRQERQSACRSASEGDVPSRSALDPKTLGAEMGDPLSKATPSVVFAIANWHDPASTCTI